jgi:hypothetical protein
VFSALKWYGSENFLFSIGVMEGIGMRGLIPAFCNASPVNIGLRRGAEFFLAISAKKTESRAVL